MADSLSPQWSLINSIIQGGPKCLHYVLERGIKPDYLGDKNSGPRKVLEFFSDFISSDRIPGHHEIGLATGIRVPTYDDKLDIKICTDNIVKTTVRAQIMENLDKNQDLLLKDPLSFRDQLYDTYHDTGWVKGTETDSTANPKSILEVIDNYKETKSMIGKGIVGLSSPWPSLDERTRGLQKGHLNIIVAKRAVGKSQLSLVWMNHIWKNDLEPGDKIMFVSMEMDRLMVKRRLFSIAAGLDFAKFNEGRLTEDEERTFYNFCDRLMNPLMAEQPEIIFMYSDQINSVRDIEVKAAQHKPKLIIVDGLYIIGRGSSKSRWERTVDTVEELKLRLALNYPVIAIHQLKGTTKEDTLSADADELAYAKAIADYADSIYGIFADDSHKRGKQRTIRTMKGRDFLPIHWRINFDLERQDYSEIDIIDDEEAPALESEDKSSKSSSSGGIEFGGPIFGSGSEISI